jgi:hypothetical protein
MKKIIIALCLGAASSYTMAAPTSWTAIGTAVEICQAGSGAAVTAVATAFVKSAFTPKCSTNTSVYFDATTSNAAVGSISTKGNQSFKGNTNGGAVVKHADCSASLGCVGSTEAAAAVAQALTDAGSN